VLKDFGILFLEMALFNLSKFKRFNGYNKSLSYSVIILLLFGLLMVFEASSSYSYLNFGSRYKFFFQQFVWVLLGLLGVRILYRMEFPSVEKVVKYLWYVSVSFLAVLAVQSVLSFVFHTTVQTPFTKITYGAFRWVVINPEPLPSLPVLGRVSFQPSDLAKLSFVVYFSSILSRMGERNTRKIAGYFMLTILVVGLVAIEPDFGTAFIFLGMSFALYVAAGFPVKYLFAAIPIIVIVGSVFSFSSSYRRERILTFLRPEVSNQLEGGYQITQISIALGSGGLFGLGFGESRQKYAYIPEVSSDSIFAVIGEEFGFIGTALFVAVLLYVLWICLNIASWQRDPLKKLVVVGIASWIGFQTFVNLFAMVHLIPLTGVTLPFVSYGGSSMIFSLLGMGLIFNASKECR